MYKTFYFGFDYNIDHMRISNNEPLSFHWGNQTELLPNWTLLPILPYYQILEVSIEHCNGCG